jgi:hypothetical protein
MYLKALEQEREQNLVQSAWYVSLFYLKNHIVVIT